jgi:hypothetical protein
MQKFAVRQEVLRVLRVRRALFGPLCLRWLRERQAPCAGAPPHAPAIALADLGAGLQVETRPASSPSLCLGVPGRVTHPDRCSERATARRR